MSYAVGNRQFSIKDFRRAIFDENPVGNARDFRRESDRKSLVGNCFEPDFSNEDRKRAKNTAVSLGLTAVYEAHRHMAHALYGSSSDLSDVALYCWCLIPHNTVLAVDPNEGRGMTQNLAFSSGFDCCVRSTDTSPMHRSRSRCVVCDITASVLIGAPFFQKLLTVL